MIDSTKSTASLNTKDIEYMETLGISQEQVESQIHMFKQGIPFTTLSRRCIIGDGITSLGAAHLKDSEALFQNATLVGRVMKFVPASGAASRMFKSLLACLEQFSQQGLHSQNFQWDPAEHTLMQKFLKNLPLFSFSSVLLQRFQEASNGTSPQQETQYLGHLLTLLLTSEGLNYAALPKGLLPFHQYDDHVRTPIEEHLVEAQTYARDQHGIIRVHFTISPEHELAVKQYIQTVLPQYTKPGETFNLGFSLQKSSTNTIAVDTNNDVFRDREGNMVFRPGGHGALIENLNDLQGDIIFIKNVDNVVPDHMKETTYTWKKILAGHLISIQNVIFPCIERLMERNLNASCIKEICAVAKKYLCLEIPQDFDQWDLQAQVDFLIEKFNRPIRVCGMVKNVGEAGGGPFWVKDKYGTSSLQIIESSQVDPQSPTEQELFRSSTHFNPVDLVCGVRDYQGKLFDLRNFTDPNAGFIAEKSYQGRDLRALELPGLWNGGMANWNTIFVDIPLNTFNPVKTVFDLLRPEHQPSLPSSHNA